MARANEVDLCRLFDGKISVRLYDREICILPNKAEMAIDDLEKAMQKLVDEVAAVLEW